MSDYPYRFKKSITSNQKAFDEAIRHIKLQGKLAGPSYFHPQKGRCAIGGIMPVGVAKKIQADFPGYNIGRFWSLIEPVGVTKEFAQDLHNAHDWSISIPEFIEKLKTVAKNHNLDPKKIETLKS